LAEQESGGVGNRTNMEEEVRMQKMMSLRERQREIGQELGMSQEETEAFGLDQEVDDSRPSGEAAYLEAQEEYGTLSDSDEEFLNTVLRQMADNQLSPEEIVELQEEMGKTPPSDQEAVIEYAEEIRRATSTQEEIRNTADVIEEGIELSPEDLQSEEESDISAQEEASQESSSQEEMSVEEVSLEDLSKDIRERLLRRYIEVLKPEQVANTLEVMQEEEGDGHLPLLSAVRDSYEGIRDKANSQEAAKHLREEGPDGNLDLSDQVEDQAMREGMQDTLDQLGLDVTAGTESAAGVSTRDVPVEYVGETVKTDSEYVQDAQALQEDGRLRLACSK
jgi:hypothetical protein